MSQYVVWHIRILKLQNMPLWENVLSERFLRHAHAWTLEKRYVVLYFWNLQIQLETMKGDYIPSYSFLSAFAKLRKATSISIMSVCPPGTTRLPLDWFSWNLEYFRKLVKKIQVLLKSHKNNGYDQYAFWIISCSFILRMRNVAAIICSKTQNTHFT